MELGNFLIGFSFGWEFIIIVIDCYFSIWVDLIGELVEIIV